MNDQIIGLLNPAISLIFFTVFTGLWWRARNRRYVLGFAIGNLAFALSMLCYHYSDIPYSWTALLVMHVGLAGWSISYSWGACVRVGQSISIKLYVAISVLAAVIILMTIPEHDENARLYATNGYVGLLMALSAHTLSRVAPRDFIDRAIVWVFAIIAVQSYIRPMIVMIARGVSPEVPYRESAFYSLFVVSVALVTVTLGLLLCAAVAIDNLRRVQQDSSTDALTGLRTRGKFEEEALDLLDRAALRDVPVGMIVADIDLFKQVNDIFGHQTGDRVIASFGKLCGTMVRGSDLTGRIGGEEFCVLAWNCDEEAVQRLAERIRLSFAKLSHDCISAEIRVTASFGVASWNRGEGYGKLFARADAALYRAKREGRNQVVTDMSSTPAVEESGTEAAAQFLEDRRSAKSA